MYIAWIRKKKTKEIRGCKIDLDWDEGSLFWWTEGNYGCDCNRELTFERAGGLDPDIDDVVCGEGAFSVLFVELETGERIPIDCTKKFVESLKW